MILKKKKNTENYLDKVPVVCRDLDWTQNNDFVTIKQKNDGFYDKLAQRLMNTPKTSNIHLDEFGSYVWMCIDGDRTVYEIAEKLKAKFGEEAEPLIPRLVEFLKTLTEVKYVAIK